MHPPDGSSVNPTRKARVEIKARERMSGRKESWIELKGEMKPRKNGT